MGKIEDNFRKWWYDEGASMYAEQIDSGAPMRDIIEKIFDAGQMAAIDQVKTELEGTDEGL